MINTKKKNYYKMENQVQLRSEKLDEYQLARQSDLCKPELASLNDLEKKVVKTYSQYPLLRNLPDGQFEVEIRRMIITVCGLLGIKNLPDDLTLPFIMRFIREHYSGLSVEAMIHAFELNAAGMLSEKRHEHYQNFGIELIADVLGDYTDLKRKVNTTVKQLMASNEQDIDVTNQDCYNYLVSFVKKNGHPPLAYSWQKVFNYMKSSGMVTESDEWMAEFKKKMSDKMAAEFLVQKLKTPNAIDRINIDRQFNDENIQKRCRKEYVIYKVGKG